MSDVAPSARTPILPTDQRSLLAQHPALAISAGYLVISLLGLSYEWVQFRFFGVNFFHYAEVTDFLMGAFREPITFVLSMSAFAIGWLVHIYSRWELGWLNRKPPKSWLGRRYLGLVSSRLYRASPVIFFVGYSVMFIWVYSSNRADAIRAGDGETIQVEVAAGQDVRPPVDSPSLMLGSSTRFLFVYRPIERVIEIIPNENIARIVITTDRPPPELPNPTGATR
jgi:hypothetical protein